MTKTFIRNIQPIADTMHNEFQIDKDECLKILFKAKEGGEFKEDSECLEWYNERFKWATVSIDEDSYAQMCIDALKTVQFTAATDFGSTRQRDLGQLWSDMIRGYLGEYAFKEFLKIHWDIDAKLAHEKGDLAEYLPTDIPEIKRPSMDWEKAKINIGIKTTKWQGIWLDITGDQFNHSDLHVLIKVGTGRDHLFGFFKKISVFKDKILQLGQNIGALNKQEADSLFDTLPSYHSIKAYICGFVDVQRDYSAMSYGGKKGNIHYTVTSWNGPYDPDDFDRIKTAEKLSDKAKVQLLGIGQLTNQPRYLFNTGNFLWNKSDWDRVISRL